MSFFDMGKNFGNFKEIPGLSGMSPEKLERYLKKAAEQIEKHMLNALNLPQIDFKETPSYGLSPLSGVSPSGLNLTTTWGSFLSQKALSVKHMMESAEEASLYMSLQPWIGDNESKRKRFCQQVLLAQRVFELNVSRIHQHNQEESRKEAAAKRNKMPSPNL